MSLLDDLRSIPTQQVQNTTVAPPKPEGGFHRPGYFEWDKHSKNNEVVGVILPPYKDWISERILAAKNGKPFSTPFFVRHGVHGIGSQRDKTKVFLECRKTALKDNNDGNGYGILHPEVVSGGDSCPVCDTCWNVLWPKVEEHKHNKSSPEYLAAKEAHRQTCPQQRYLFNFLPQGSDTPLIIDASKTLGEQIQNIHYDIKQPDLLWPFSNPPAFLSAWIQIRREKNNDTTKYFVSVVYIGIPHVLNNDQSFNQDGYNAILAKISDLREVSKTFAPTQNDLTKANAKVQSILTNFSINVQRSHEIADRIERATEGVSPVIAAIPPAVQIGGITKDAIKNPIVSQPPASNILPAIPSVVTPATVVAPASAVPSVPSQSDEANNLLNNLLNIKQ